NRSKPIGKTRASSGASRRSAKRKRQRRRAMIMMMKRRTRDCTSAASRIIINHIVTRILDQFEIHLDWEWRSRRRDVTGWTERNYWPMSAAETEKLNS